MQRFRGDHPRIAAPTGVSTGCPQGSRGTHAELATAPDKNAPATASDADTFVARAEKDLADISVDSNRAGWINETYITDDTDAMAARINAVGTEKSVQYAPASST